MDTMQRIAHSKVFMTVALDNLQQGASLTMRHIGQPHPFLSTRDMLIILLEQRYQLIDKGATLLIQHLASLCHLFLPELQHQRVRRRVLHLQQDVTLLKGIVVTAQRIDIRAVVLGNNHIHQFTTLLATPFNE